MRRSADVVIVLAVSDWKPEGERPPEGGVVEKDLDDTGVRNRKDTVRDREKRNDLVIVMSDKYSLRAQ